MRLNESTYEIITNQYDYGVPVIFEVDEGISIGDTLVLVFDTDVIPDKVVPIPSEGHSFPFALTKEQAEALFDHPIHGDRHIAYSIKRYRGEEFLESLENKYDETVFNLTVKSTLKYEKGESGDGGEVEGS